MWSELLRNEAGLRDGQLGALLALRAHFLGSHADKPAQVQLPTGYGKSLVMLLTQRLFSEGGQTLVVCGSVPLRLQLAQAFEEYFGQGSREQASPTGRYAQQLLPLHGEHDQTVLVRENNDELLANVESSSVVIAHPASLLSFSPRLPGGEGRVKLILFDEGHHTPAETWRNIVELNPGAKVVQFTATPFRGDRAPLLGRLIFSYSLRKAISESAIEDAKIEVVSRSETLGVLAEAPSSTDSERPTLADLALVTRAISVLREMRQDYADARLMVKCNSTVRANSLYQAYEAFAPDLRVLLLHSTLGLERSRVALSAINTRAFDVVVTVEMLAEGVDIPELRVLAVHDNVSDLRHFVQVTGRITRRAGCADSIQSKLLCLEGTLPPELTPVPSSLSELSERVGAVVLREELRQDLLAQIENASLSDAAFDKILEEAELRQHAIVFAVDPAGDTSWQGLKRMGDARVALLRSYESQGKRVQIAVLAVPTRPLWLSGLSSSTDTPGLIVTFEPSTPAGEQRLLFATSSPEARKYLRHVIEYINESDVVATRVGLGRLKRVFSKGRDVSYFNVGLRSRTAVPMLERYRIATGPEVERSMNATTAHGFAQGHVMGRLSRPVLGTADQEQPVRDELYGVSDKGTLWGVNTVSLDELCEKWFTEVARRLRSTVGVATSLLESVPAPIEWTSAELGTGNGSVGFWGGETVVDVPSIRSEDALNGSRLVDLEIGNIESDGEQLFVSYKIDPVLDDKTQPAIAVRLSKSGSLVSCSPDPNVVIGTDEWPLSRWLEADPPTLMLANGKSVTGIALAPALEAGTVFHFVRSALLKADWTDVALDEEKPPSLLPAAPGTGKGKAAPPRVPYDPLTATDRSIFRFVARKLIEKVTSGALLAVVCDDNSSELADFIAVRKLPDGTAVVELYLCKATKNRASPGLRSVDLQELWSQALRASQLLTASDFLEHLKRRDMKLVKMSSNLAAAKKIFADAISNAPAVKFELILVQPGIALGGVDLEPKAKVKPSNTLAHAFAWLESSFRVRGVSLFLVGSPVLAVGRGRPSRNPAAKVYDSSQIQDVFARY